MTHLTFLVWNHSTSIHEAIWSNIFYKHGSGC